MKQTLQKLFSLLFPERDDARIVRTLSFKTLRGLYQHQIVRGDNTYSLLPYSDSRVRACVHEAKFHKNEQAFQLLSTVLSQYLRTQHIDILVPIPLTYKRQKKRGYNQVTRIVESSEAKHLLDTEILYKHTDTKPQTKLNRDERLHNVKDVFAVYDTPKNRKKILGAHLLILDDVTTTGATLEAAKTALLLYEPAQITCLALAH